MDAEQWKAIPDCEGLYEASSCGQIRHAGGLLLSQYKDVHGVRRVHLLVNGIKRRCQVHRLVAAAFFGAIETGLEVNHKDCNRSNNRADNLEIVTSDENRAHYRRTLQVRALQPSA